VGVDAEGVRVGMEEGDAAGGGPAHFHRLAQDDGKCPVEVKMGYDGPCGSQNVVQALVDLEDPHGCSASLPGQAA